MASLFEFLAWTIGFLFSLCFFFNADVRKKVYEILEIILPDL